MKNMKKILALVLAMMLVLGMTAALADDPSTPSITIQATSDDSTAKKDLTQYTWYRILEADIQEDPTGTAPNQTGGKVSYYTDSAAKVTELNKTNLFNISRVGETDKWYVELKSDSTTAEQIVTGIKLMDLTKFPTGTFAQTTVHGTATSGTVAPGYYYLTSTAGTNAVLQTLTAVTITEKNTFPPVDKTIDEDDVASEIGKIVHYTLTVEVPSTANDVIVLTDTMDSALDFGEIESVKSNAENTPDVEYTVAPASPTVANVKANGNVFTITFSAATVIANQGKTITVEYNAVVNNSAVVLTDIPNTIELKYGNNYESKPKTVNTKTYPFDFDKVDGSNTTQKLSGAEFELRRTADGAAIPLVAVTAGQTYRIATSDDTTTVTKIVTDGHTVTINGLDLDDDYYLVETKAPTGYNGLAEAIKLRVNNSAFVHEDVLNNKGTALPSTGGIGTTIFYVGGGILVLLAVVLLVTKRRMKAED